MGNLENENIQQAAKGVQLLRTFLIFIAGAFLTGFLALFLEYKSGLFQPLRETDPSSIKFNFVIAYIILLIAFIVLFKKTASILFQPYRFAREDFAVISVLLILNLTAVVMTSVFSGLMPWYIPTIIYKGFLNEAFLVPDARLGDYFALLASFGLMNFMLYSQHQRWSGLKSVNQFQAEQSGEPQTLIMEGLGELIRIVKRRPKLKIHHPVDYSKSVAQLLPAVDSLDWKEQSKELVRLSTTSYIFDDQSWHDRNNCWLGFNVNTNQLVFIFPLIDPPDIIDLEKFVRYAKKISQNRGKVIEEIIVASKKSASPLVFKKFNTPITFTDENKLLDGLIDFKDYFLEIKKRFLVDKLSDSQLTLNETYVPSTFFTTSPPSFGYSPDEMSIEDFLDTWLEEPGQRQIALLGEYGQGKSTASLAWAFHHITNSTSPKRIPLIMELRGTSPRNLTPLQFLGAWASQYNINAQALMRYIIAGRVVLIFEGFDEMALVGNAEMRLKHFKTLWNFAYPESKIIITGRPNFFLDENEMKAALGILQPIGHNPFCQAVRLEPFNPTRIELALRAYDSSTRDQITSLAKTNARFLELISRPSLLHIVGVLWEKEKLVEKIDLLTSAYIMDLFIRHSYRRQGQKEKDSPDFMALTTFEREYFMIGIASYMASNNLPNQINNSQLDDIVSSLIEFIPESITTANSVILGESAKPLRVRLKDIEHGNEFVKTDVRACGLLVDDPAAIGTFRFGHKSFMEYLFANVIAESLRRNTSGKSLSILKATKATIVDILSLPVAAQFLAELVGEDFRNDDPLQRDYKIATSLRRAIFPSVMSRVTLFIEVHMLLVMKYVRTNWLLRLLFLIMPIIFPMLAVLITWTRFRSHNDQMPNLDEGFISSPLVIMGVMFLVSFFFFYFYLFRTPRNLKVWLRLCEILRIPEQVLYKILFRTEKRWSKRYGLYDLK